MRKFMSQLQLHLVINLPKFILYNLYEIISAS